MSPVDGAAANVLEQLQGTYENEPGFLAVVNDGAKAIVVVDARMVDEWRTRMAPHDVAVAPSCIDPRLLAAVLAALPGIDRPPNATTSAGYDALEDAIVVRGVSRDNLVNALAEAGTGMQSAAIDAIAAATLRVDPAVDPATTRGSRPTP
jgi:hypothetical protein